MSTVSYYLGLFAAAYLATTILLYMISLRVPVAGFFARLLASYVSVIVCSSYGVIVSIALRLVGYGGLSQWATGRSFKYVMWLTTGISFKIDDPNDYLNQTRPAVFIGNHQTELDVMMLGCIFPKYCSVTAKKSLKSVPFLGWFMVLSGTVFIDRANSADARHAMAGASEEIRNERQSVYMFPEGTRSYAKEPMLLPFKKGAFHLAVQAGVPIVPVVVANYSDVLHLQGWRFKSGVIPIKGVQVCFDHFTSLTTSSAKANRDERPQALRRRRSGERYKGFDAQGDCELDGKGKRTSDSYARAKYRRWSYKSKWLRSHFIMSSYHSGNSLWQPTGRSRRRIREFNRAFLRA